MMYECVMSCIDTHPSYINEVRDMTHVLISADRGLCKEIVLGCVRWRDMLDELVVYRQKGTKKQVFMSESRTSYEGHIYESCHI